jgi:membrane associated rhomboid family serine protease
MMYSTNRTQSFWNFFRQRSALSNLIVINTVIFLLINVFILVCWLFKFSPYASESSLSYPAYWLSVPADPHQIFLRPWGIFTYMFVQQDLFHLFFNMITLYFGGQIFLRLLNEKKLLSTYILGGFMGALFFVISFNIFPVFEGALPGAIAIGASASVLAILVAAAAYAPNFEVLLLFVGRVKLKYIAIVLILIDLLSISQDNPGGHIAHLGGAAWGFFYIRYLLNKGWKGFPSQQKSSGWFRRKPKKQKYSSTRTVSDEEYNARKNENQEKIDKILEKISKNGYEGLSKEEKEILFKAGKE